MKFLLLMISAVSVLSDCSIRSCSCPDIIELAFNNYDMLYSEEKGCVRNISCPWHTQTFAQSQWNQSEIPAPDDYQVDYPLFEINTNPNMDDPPGPHLDIFSYFGMVCEDNTWYVTKYPMGISYFTNSEISEYVTIGSPEEYNGKKSRIEMFQCTMNSEAGSV